MIFNNTLAAVRDDENVGNTGINGFFYDILDSGLIGMDFVAGNTLVPSPAAGMTAFLTFIILIPPFIYLMNRGAK